ncbi:MAG: sulfotransferase domain-containing protein, partial [Planctomycetota bacterium]
MNVRLRVYRVAKRVAEACRYRAARLHPSPVFILGHQKSGTTAIAALLGRLVDRPVTLDLPREIRAPTFHLVRMGEMSIDAFIRRNRLDFSRPIIKAPNLTLLHDHLRARYPASRFIMIVRDPRDTIRSVLNRVGLPGDLPAIPADRLDDLPPGRRLLLDNRWLGCTSPHYVGQLAERWNLFADVYLDQADAFILVRYEDFCAD